jgi:hypothetical protein
MKVDPNYILSQYQTDGSIIKEFEKKYKDYEFENFLHMLSIYEEFVDNLNLTYIEDEV